MSPSSTADLETLVDAGRANDNAAWTELVTRFERLLRAIARSYRLSPADVDDVLQSVWLALHQQIGRLRDPNALAGWLATTARRESLRVARSRQREWPTGDPELFDGAVPDDLDDELLATEREQIVRRALATLPARQRRLMVLLVTAPEDYRRISATLDMPIGSIGPTRARGLDRLSRHPELRELHLASC